MRNYNCDIIGTVISVEESPDYTEFYMSVKRPGREDIIPFIVNNQVLSDKVIEINSVLRVIGIVRTVKTYLSTKLRVDVVSFEPSEDVKRNNVFGKFVVKAIKNPMETKSGLSFRDIIIKSEIPDEGISEFRAVLWGDKAENCDLVPGSTVYIVGRLQSREYFKRDGNNKVKVRTYEVSVGKMEEDSDRYAEVVEDV